MIELPQQAVISLLDKCGFTNFSSLSPLEGGGNNRVYRVHLGNSDTKSLLLKVYFKSREDTRNRLLAEFSFLDFAYRNGIKNVPKPYGSDFEQHLGLYEFIEGRHLRADDLVSEDKIFKCLNFFIEINRSRHLKDAQSLPFASEASFSLAGHLRCVEKRLNKLFSIEVKDDVHQEAFNFISKDMQNLWIKIVAHLTKSVKQLKIEMEQPIPEADRCLSPSDFGFHNALLTTDQQLYFIDFEYAGWDDPAKMICDFFCQEAVPVPMNRFGLFTEEIVSNLSRPAFFKNYVHLLLPLYQFKWCCIILNTFIREDAQRRAFAKGSLNIEEERMEQLKKARLRLQQIKLENN